MPCRNIRASVASPTVTAVAIAKAAESTPSAPASTFPDEAVDTPSSEGCEEGAVRKGQLVQGTVVSVDSKAAYVVLKPDDDSPSEPSATVFTLSWNNFTKLKGFSPPFTTGIDGGQAPGTLPLAVGEAIWARVLAPGKLTTSALEVGKDTKSQRIAAGIFDEFLLFPSRFAT